MCVCVFVCVCVCVCIQHTREFSVQPFIDLFFASEMMQVRVMGEGSIKLIRTLLWYATSLGIFDRC